MSIFNKISSFLKKIHCFNYKSFISNLSRKKELITLFATVAVSFTAIISIGQNHNIINQQQNEELTRLRSYVSLEESVIESINDDTHPYRLRLTLKNNGLTPANDLSVKMYLSTPDRRVEFITPDELDSVIFLQPSAQITSSRNLKEEALKFLRNSNINKVITEISYKDYKSKQHIFITEFSIRHFEGKDFLHIQRQFEEK